MPTPRRVMLLPPLSFAMSPLKVPNRVLFTLAGLGATCFIANNFLQGVEAPFSHLSPGARRASGIRQLGLVLLGRENQLTTTMQMLPQGVGWCPRLGSAPWGTGLLALHGI